MTFTIDRTLQPLMDPSNIINVLLVEDNLTDADKIQEILSDTIEYQYSISHVTRQSHAFKRLASQRVDVLLTELDLPDSRGLDTLSRFLLATEATPIIVLTDTLNKGTGAMAVSRGAQDYLTKDLINSQTLTQAIRHAIERHHLFYAATINEQRSKLLVENAPIAFFTISNAGKLISGNPALIKLLEIDSSKDLIGIHYDHFLYAENTDDVKSMISKAVCLDSIIENQPITIRCKNGAKKYVMLNLTPLLNQDDSVSAAQGTMCDITELTKAKEAWVEAVQQLSLASKLESIGQLAAGIAHEINTPSQFVADNMHYIKDTFADFNGLFKLYEQLIKQLETLELSNAVTQQLEKIASYTGKIDLEFLQEDVFSATNQALDGISTISKIVRAMKGFSYPGGGTKEMVELNSAIENTLTVSRNEWKYAAEIVTEFNTELPMVECMPMEINQAVLNIVVNAAHAIEERQRQENDTSRGTITIRTAVEEPYVVIQISDTGCGISQKNLRKVFDSFFTTKEQGKGTGQGLSIAHAVIVNTHNGKLEVDSKLDQGTCFTIRLPVGTQDEQSKE